MPALSARSRHVPEVHASAFLSTLVPVRPLRPSFHAAARRPAHSPAPFIASDKRGHHLNPPGIDRTPAHRSISAARNDAYAVVFLVVGALSGKRIAEATRRWQIPLPPAKARQAIAS
jgi:hypothetical protein